MTRNVVVAWLVLAAVLLQGCARAPLQQQPRGDFVHRVTLAGAALAYCASTPVEAWTPRVRRVVVAVHGLDRNACGMRRAVADALGGEPEDTVVVAPQFASRLDAVPGGHVWRDMQWPAGAESDAGASSYAVLDELVTMFGDRQVTLVGFSGGGQFTNRYAAVSAVTLHAYLVINPSSYLWFSPDRPGPTASCPTYDHWRYGLDHRAGYAARLSVRQVEKQYAARAVRYLVGSADDDPRSPSLDRSCAAMAQGTNREDRARNYHRHLVDVFGPDVAARQPLIVVPGVGHQVVGMLGTDAARAALEPAPEG